MTVDLEAAAPQIGRAARVPAPRQQDAQALQPLRRRRVEVCGVLEPGECALVVAHVREVLRDRHAAVAVVWLGRVADVEEAADGVLVEPRAVQGEHAGGVGHAQREAERRIERERLGEGPHQRVLVVGHGDVEVAAQQHRVVEALQEVPEGGAVLGQQAARRLVERQPQQARQVPRETQQHGHRVLHRQGASDLLGHGFVEALDLVVQHVELDQQAVVARHDLTDHHRPHVDVCGQQFEGLFAIGGSVQAQPGRGTTLPRGLQLEHRRRPGLPLVEHLVHEVRQPAREHVEVHAPPAGLRADRQRQEHHFRCVQVVLRLGGLGHQLLGMCW